GAKRLKVYGIRSLGCQVRIEEILMGEFVIGIVMDVLGHIRVELLKSDSIEWIPTAAWYFAVLNAPEFVVLHPEIGFQDFCRCADPRPRRLPWSESASFFFRSLLS